MKIYISLLALLFIISSSTFSQIMFTASMDGSQETPAPVSTTATGTAWLVLSADFKSISYSVTYARLSTGFIGGHFHAGAMGVGGGVVLPLAFTGNTAKGVWNNIPDSIIAKLFNGQLYVNVHSSANPGGEIRGQFKFVDGIGFAASIDGSQENPPVSTNGSGTGFAIIENNGTQISYRFTIAGLSSNFTASHLHNAAVGVNGSVVKPLDFGTDSTTTGVWTGFADPMLTQFIKNNIYMNVHSTNFPGGEMRGQLIHQGEVLFTATLNGAQEVPPVTTDAQGTGWAILRNDGNSIYYRETFARLSALFSAGHIHVAAAGSNGSVIKPFTFVGNSAEGVYTNVPDSLIVQFIKGNTYLNVHTTAHPSGEIRGQLNYTSGIGFVTTLDGAQEIPALTVNGQGTGYFIWGAPVQNALNFQVTIAGLSSAYTGSHFHVGAPGVSGGVVHPYNFGTDSTINDVWTGPSDANIISLVQGNMYTNVHTSNNPGGEIRGQLIFTNILSGNLTSVNDLRNEIPSKFVLNQNYPNPFNPSTIISFSVTEKSRIMLKVYDILGRVVDVLADGIMNAGIYKINFDGRKLASGIYIYSLSSDRGDLISKKMVFLK
jgi:CHRD domain/Secretion system C-terminal sorting domain